MSALVSTPDPWENAAMLKYGTWLRLRREERNLTQEGLAERAGINRSHLNRIERGAVSLPGREMRERINQALGIAHDDPGYLRTLPVHERAVEALSRDEEGLSLGQMLDRTLLFATDRERAIISELITALDRLFPTEG
jgi:transcriptional regulator with XRE-family HTH domain